MYNVKLSRILKSKIFLLLQLWMIVVLWVSKFLVVKGKDFASFLGELIRNNTEIKENLQKTVFYFDNAKIHKADV